MSTLGYGPPLPAPIPAVQTTMAAIDVPELHAFIQESDIAVINETDEEGIHGPLLLDTLDLAAWTSLFVTATSDKTKTFSRLRTAQSRLQELLTDDEMDAVRSAELAQRVEAVLKLANEDELNTDAVRSIMGPEDSKGGSNTHPLLAKLRISDADKNALEEYCDGILSTQLEKQKNTMVTSKGPVVPIKPPRSVELLVAECQHRMWAIGNTNLLAPISIPMWQAWTGFTDQEVDSYKKQALNNIGVLRTPMDLTHAFPLTMFDHAKCTTLEVKLHTKQDLPTGHNRKESHLSEMWNVQRPYMRCLCNPRAINGCKGSIIWFDHAVWTMINKLEVFFPNYPTAVARFAAFMIWMRESARVAVKAAIVFHITREYMINAAIQLSENPNQRLLMDITDTPIAGKIERLLKGPKFSLAHPGSPSKAPSPYKRQKFNLNSSPTDRALVGGRGRGAPGSRGGSARGGRGYRGRGGGRSGRNPSQLTPPPGRLMSLWGSPVTTQDASEAISLTGGSPAGANGYGSDTPGSTNTMASPLKRRVLLWDDEA